MNIVERMQSPTPSFFKTLRNIGVILAAASGSVLSAAAILPDCVVNIAGYLAVAGTIAGAVSQAAVKNDE